jgi:hypothetical protein
MVVDPRTVVSNLMAQQQPTALIALLVLSLLGLAAVVVWLALKVNGGSRQGSAAALTNQVVELKTLSAPVEVGAARFPSGRGSSGRTFSMSWWLYLDRYEQTSTRAGSTVTPVDKLIMYRGPSSDGLSSATPVVWMDGQTNRLYVAIKTSQSTLDTRANANPYYIRSQNYYSNNTLRLQQKQPGPVNRHVILTVDYVPLQRWTHIAVVADERAVTLYVDAQIYSIKTLEEFRKSSRRGRAIVERDPYGRPLEPDNLIIDDAQQGSLFVGGTGGHVAAAPVPGRLGRIFWWNYAAGPEDVRRAYRAGPGAGADGRGGGWARLGGYGLRAPVYKLAASQPATAAVA